MGKETGVATLTRRSLLGNSVGLAAAGALARPYIAHAAATTVETWWNQGFIPEEDAAFRAMAPIMKRRAATRSTTASFPTRRCVKRRFRRYRAASSLT